MIVPLWVLALVARYVKYVPILGWRFSEDILKRLEARMDREVDVNTVDVSLTEDAPPSQLDVEVALTNELPVDLAVTGVNLRIGYADESRTVANVLWAADAHGSTPANLETPVVTSGSTGTTHVERYLPADARGEALHVDGSITTTARLDVPAAKGLPLGDLERDVPDTRIDLPD